MLQQTNLVKLDDYFLKLGARPARGVYFYRVNAYQDQIHAFLIRYYEAARTGGVIIEGKIQNPTPQNLDYFGEILGGDFQYNEGFLRGKLKKWLPRMSPAQCDNVAKSIYATLRELQSAGKNENMLKNAYMKFMCWLYYKFERIVHRLGEDDLPKLLYEGTPGNYELLFLSVLSQAGCDIVMLQYGGDGEYRKLDPGSRRSQALAVPDGQPFPADFSLKRVREEIQSAQRLEQLCGPPPQQAPCTNAWITGALMDCLRKAPERRGQDGRFFYNCFALVHGVEDRLAYPNALYQLQLDLRGAGRSVVIVNGPAPPPTVQEIDAIQRQNYRDLEQLLSSLSANLRFFSNQELRRLATRAFVETIQEENEKPNTNANANANLNRLTGKAVTLLCWAKRYCNPLFGNWRPGQVSCFFHFGGCTTENAALFCRFLSRLPVDVVIWKPDLTQENCLEAKHLYQVHYSESLSLAQYPETAGTVRAGTSAYHAERDLDTLLYQDSGLYRNQQFTKAEVILLQTMYEEIWILWDQELKFRPNFDTADGTVRMPVLFSKISGVKDGNIAAYWSGIQKLMTEDTIVIQSVPNLVPGAPNPQRAYAAEFWKQGRLQRDRIKSHRAYPYGFLRETMQEYLLDKLQALIAQKTIRGTFETGTEYTIIATVLNLDQEILRQIQKFDFTKKNPKIIYILTGETMLSLEDTIQAAFLSQVGFDVLFFVPTGYQCVEKYFAKNILEEHQAGEYQYDMVVPDFQTISAKPSKSSRPSWRDILFRRGV